MAWSSDRSRLEETVSWHTRCTKLDRKAEELLYRVAERFMCDYRAGVFRSTPLSKAAYSDCLIEYGAGYYTTEPLFLRRLAERVNREVALIGHQRIAGRKNGLPAILAASFRKAILSGRLPTRRFYTYAQAHAYVVGAVGDGLATVPVLREFAIAHNVTNDDVGLIEVQAVEETKLIAEWEELPQDVGLGQDIEENEVEQQFNSPGPDTESILSMTMDEFGRWARSADGQALGEVMERVDNALNYAGGDWDHPLAVEKSRFIDDHPEIFDLF